MRPARLVGLACLACLARVRVVSIAREERVVVRGATGTLSSAGLTRGGGWALVDIGADENLEHSSWYDESTASYTSVHSILIERLPSLCAQTE